MKLRRIIWFAITDFTSKVSKEVTKHEKKVQIWSALHKTWLMNKSSKKRLMLATDMIAWHERKAEHYRKFLRTH